uniref:Putative plant transposon protein domain-containing protein n=1 Tax=Solanum tuberosum TaxID=4113 RepID=M1DUH5_SOLTU
MAPKGKNVAIGSGTKRSRKGAATGSSSRETTNLPPKKFGKQALMHYGEDWYECEQESKYLGDEYVDEGRLRQEFPHIHTQIHALGLQYVFVDQGECNLSLVREFYVNWNTHHIKLNQGLIRDSRVRFTLEALNEFLGTPNCGNSEFLAMIERPYYLDIRHTFCGVNSIARWDRVRDTGRHLTLYYGHFNLEVRIWLKYVCSTLLSCKHTTNVTRERVVLVYRWMKGLPMNVGAILEQNMLKFRTSKRWHFCYGSIINRYLRALQIEEEVRDM